MSVQALSFVFDQSPVTGNDRLVLLSLANHAHGDGTRAYPSVEVISREAACSERTVQRALSRMVESGVLADEGPAPDERIPQNRRPKSYQIVGVGVTPMTPQADLGVTPSSPQKTGTNYSGVTDQAFRGDTGVTQTKYKPKDQEQSNDKSSDASSRNDEPAAGLDSQADPGERETARVKPAKNAKASTALQKAEAGRITTEWYDWVKARSGHPPAESYLAIRGIILAALKAEFTEKQIRAGLSKVRAAKRPLTKQTLWEYANGDDARPAARAKPKGVNEPWLNDLERVQRADHEARLAESAPQAPSDDSGHPTPQAAPSDVTPTILGGSRG